MARFVVGGLPAGWLPYSDLLAANRMPTGSQLAADGCRPVADWLLRAADRLPTRATRPDRCRPADKLAANRLLTGADRQLIGC